jgi:hypothetical protein
MKRIPLKKGRMVLNSFKAGLTLLLIALGKWMGVHFMFGFLKRKKKENQEKK